MELLEVFDSVKIHFSHYLSQYFKGELNLPDSTKCRAFCLSVSIFYEMKSCFPH